MQCTCMCVLNLFQVIAAVSQRLKYMYKGFFFPGTCSETGYENGQYTLVLYNHAVLRHETKTKLLIFDF